MSRFTAGGLVSDVGWSVVSEHVIQDVDTVDVAVQISTGKEESIARRQLFQLSITNKGKWNISRLDSHSL